MSGSGVPRSSTHDFCEAPVYDDLTRIENVHADPPHRANVDVRIHSVTDTTSGVVLAVSWGAVLEHDPEIVGHGVKDPLPPRGQPNYPNSEAVDVKRVFGLTIGCFGYFLENVVLLAFGAEVLAAVRDD
jgi:hypothetical protein